MQLSHQGSVMTSSLPLYIPNREIMAQPLFEYAVQENLPLPAMEDMPLTPWKIARRPIAVVDDSLDDQFVLRRELGFLFGQMPVVTFQSGAGLLAYLNEHDNEQGKPWLILLDMHMPRIDGLRTLDLLNERHDFADIPVLVISATHNDNEIQTALQKGARAFMPKPLSRFDFMEILNGKDTGMAREVALQERQTTGASKKED